MLDQLLSQFAGSSQAADLVTRLVGEGLAPEQAGAAVAATAEGARQAIGDAGPGALLGALGGGGGLMMGALGGLVGGGAAEPSGPVVDAIASFVAGKVGIDETTARRVVTLALPKLVELVRGQSAGGLFG